MDAPGFTAYVDPPSLERFRARGRDPEAMMRATIAAENAVIEGFDGVTFGIHLCRGNEQSHWHREGHYDAIAEELFGTLRHDRLLLEYDTERAGGFAPLRFVRPGAIAVLGLITTKTRRARGPRRPAAPDRGGLASSYRSSSSRSARSAASRSASRATTSREDEQWAKLDLMLEVAREVWG